MEQHDNSTQTFSILIVDDNADITKSLGRLLEMRGHRIRIATNGAEAIAYAIEWKPDAILLDIGLPDRNGYEVAEELREKNVLSSIIALTGYGQHEDKLRAKSSGFDDHLTKPASFAEIEHVLLKTCAR